MKTVNQVLAYQAGGEQPVLLALSGSEQDLPAGCIGIFPNKGGCTISSLKRKIVGGATASTNYATTLGLATIDFSSVEPYPVFVQSGITHDNALYNWAKVTGDLGGKLLCIIE